MIALGYSRKKNFTDGEVTFPHLQCWNPLTMVATIVAELNGKRIACRIGQDVLEKKLHAASQEPMQSVTDYRIRLELAAKSLIEKGKFEDDGSIMIRMNDL